MPDTTIDLDRLTDLLIDPYGVPCYVEQTGGGCATLMIGTPVADPTCDGEERYPLIAGPGTFGWGQRPSVADFAEFYLGPDDDGQSESVDLAEPMPLPALAHLIAHAYSDRMAEIDAATEAGGDPMTPETVHGTPPLHPLETPHQTPYRGEIANAATADAGFSLTAEADGYHLTWTDYVANEWTEVYASAAVAFARLAALLACAETDWAAGFTVDPAEFVGEAAQFLAAVTS